MIASSKKETIMYKEISKFKTWLKCQYPTSSASVHYSSDLALFFSFGKKPPAMVTSKDVDRYISHSLQQGNKPASVNRRLSALRTFYYFLSMTLDLPLACPVLPRHRLRKPYPLPRDVDDTKIQDLFRVIVCSRDTTMFLLMLDCGLRVGEVHSLSLDDCSGNPTQILVHGKGGRQRIVYLSQRAQDSLQEWLNSRPVSKDRAVFISEHGKRLSVAGIQYLLRCYCVKAGIHVTCHQLRHTFGRHMAEADLPLTSLQSLLGHKSVRTTELYVHLSNTHLQSEFDRAMSQKKVPHPVVDGKVKCRQQHHVLSPRSVNWKAYLSNLPTWLARLIHDFCASHRQVHDPIQQTRNRLCQLSQFFRWIAKEHNPACLSDITPKLWFAYVQARQTSGIQPTSLNTALRTLRPFLKFAMESGCSICERMLQVRPLKAGESLPRAISETQLELLLQQAKELDQAWFLLMAHSGLRTCEIRALRWQDVDLNRRTIRIETSKGLRSRVVFLSAPAVKALQRLPKASDHIFTYNTLPLSNRYCQSRLNTLGRRCSVHVTPHQLRHTCATMLLNSGMSIFGVQVILGHKYLDTTLRYSRVHDSIVAKDYTQAIKSLR
jgi:site-specific recombinase XerD